MTDVTHEDRQMLADTARAWVRERAPTTHLRAVRARKDALGFDPALYVDMAEMGWAGMIVPEEFGGHDMDLESMGVLAEELGRTLTPSPLLPSAVAAVSALLLGGSPAQRARWLPGLASGTCIGSLALEEGRRFNPRQLQLGARRDSGAWRLNGSKLPVEVGIAADLFIVAARVSGAGPGGIRLFLVPSDSRGLRREPLSEVDVRGRAALVLQDVELGDDHALGDTTPDLLEGVLDRTAGVAAAEMVGAMTQAFETTIDYLKTRSQFGQLIGSFQALQHRAADMLGEIGLARAAVYDALRAIDRGDRQASLLVSVAKITAGRAFRKVAREMIQMHGGIGMTDEHDAGLYFKRAHAADLFCGNVAYHRERAARLMGF